LSPGILEDPIACLDERGGVWFPDSLWHAVEVGETDVGHVEEHSHVLIANELVLNWR